MKYGYTHMDEVAKLLYYCTYLSLLPSQSLQIFLYFLFLCLCFTITKFNRLFVLHVYITIYIY